MPKPTDEQMIRLLRVNLENLGKAITFHENQMKAGKFCLSAKDQDGNPLRRGPFLLKLRHKSEALKDILEGKAFTWADDWKPKPQVAAAVNLEGAKPADLKALKALLDKMGI